MNVLGGILVFSAIETATVAIWAKVLKLGTGLGLETQLLALAVLFVGYTVEHIVAYNVGKGRPLFSEPKP